jgi:oxepin-CoA hydrolase/3-oxo-5,6-dehydrosuberyl-CoA semialdehyde dehydrogenase
VRHSIPFNAEADSLNCAILAPDVTPDDEEFDLFVKEVAREMTVKAGQKCTAIRRAIVPRQHLDAVAERLRARLAKTVVGDPALEGVRMGALASKAQQADVAERVALLRQGAELVYGGGTALRAAGRGRGRGRLLPPTLLLSRQPLRHDAVHDIEAFGPVSTLMPYEGLDEALQLAAPRPGSLVGTLVTKDPATAARVIPVAAAWHGRLLVLDREAAAESTGHGSPLPSSSTAARAAPAAARSWAASAPSSTTCSAPRCRARPACWPRSPANTCAAPGDRDRGAPVPAPLRGPADRRVAADASPHRERGRHRELRRPVGRSLLHALRRDRGPESQFGSASRTATSCLGGGRPVRFARAGAGAGQLWPGYPALRQPVAIGDTIRARLTCKRKIDRKKKDAKGGPGRGGLGCGGQQPARRAGRQLRHPDPGGQARLSRRGGGGRTARCPFYS